MNKTLLDNLQATLGPLIENSPLKDMEQNVRALLTQAVAKLDVVTTEDFEVQKLAIAQMRSTIAALEKRVAELETKASPPKQDSQPDTAP
ncbi:MAG: accessory factor UbiK family protein [Oxalobacter sp.]|nr:accessory factor UbiK family protein [Oxalobacter sp.]